MNLVRALFAFEALVTGASGLLALAAPAIFATQALGVVAMTGLSLAAVRWLGATYVALAVLQGRMLAGADARAWRLFVPAVLVGDVLHVVGHLQLVGERGWSGGDVFAFALMALCVPARLAVWKRPALALSRAPAMAAAVVTSGSTS